MEPQAPSPAVATPSPGGLLSLLILLASTVCLCTTTAAARFPDKPLTMVVYTAPGGLMDTTARKLGALIEKSSPEVTVVIENKKGAGGLVALNNVLHRPADGHTLFALTSSVISKVMQAKQESRLDQLDYLTRVIADYECLIGNENHISSFEKLIATSEGNKAGVWLGPAIGGTDYLFARKVWNQLGLKGRWVPYKSGGEAIAALLGGHGAVYVGNPQDAQGRPNLRVLAVASPERLASFQEAPTFAELGYPKLTGESLWRGFAVRKGTSEEARTALLALIDKARALPEWQEFVQQGGMISVNEEPAQFSEIIAQQRREDKALLMQMGG